MNENENNHKEDYNRAAGSDHAMGDDEKPVMDSASPVALLLITLAAVAFLGLLGWGILIVFAP